MPLIRYHHRQKFGGMVNPMIFLVQAAENFVQAGSDRGIDPELLNALAIPPELMLQTYESAIASFNQIKAL